MDSVKYTFRFREKYLAGQVSAEEKREFEAELSRNPQLLEQLKQQIYLGEIVGEALEEDRVNTPDENTDSTHTESGLERPTPLIPLPWYREPAKMAAAVAFFLVCCVGVWWMVIRPSENQLLAEEAFKTFPNLEETSLNQTMGVDDPVDTIEIHPLKEEAFQAYRSKEYSLAREKLDAFIETGLDSLGGGLFYRGICSLELEAPKVAVEDFQNYLDLYPEGGYIEYAHFHLALSYLMINQPNFARQELGWVVKSGKKYKGRAEVLLKNVSD